MPHRSSARCSGTSATERWHCQRFLASGASSPPSSGTARDSWRQAAPRHPVLALPGIIGFRHSTLALPGIPGAGRVLATHFWHCQVFLARDGFSQLNVGTARISWRGAGFRHPVLALPGIIGFRHSTLALPGIPGARPPLAIQLWHCQGFLARGTFSPPNIGSARDSRHLPVLPGTISNSPRISPYVRGGNVSSCLRNHPSRRSSRCHSPRA